MRLHRFRFSGKIAILRSRAFPALPDTGPPSTAGFVFLDGVISTAGPMPANLPVGRDLTIRRKIENGRYYCAFGRPNRNRAPHPRSTRALLKPPTRDALAINPQTAARLRAYLDLAGHGDDLDGPLFRPLRPNGKRQDERRAMDPDAVDRVVRKFATALGLDRGCSAHSMRATFITTALENGAQLEDVQKAAGHRDAGTTKLYDRRGYNPEKAASFFATY
jgi:integrase